MQKILSLLFVVVTTTLPIRADALVDEVRFGEASARESHALETERGETFEGALGAPALRLNPPAREGWRGGTVTFTMKVDPDRANYFTAKFWGGDVTGEESRMMLFIDGKQVGQRHLGEVDQLDIMTLQPRYPGKFFYKTSPLPLAMTKGKSTVEFTIEAQGPIHGYRGKIEQYQLNMTKPSRGLYRAYTHTDPKFSPAADEPQGEPIIEHPAAEPVDPEGFEQIKQTINQGLDRIINGKDELRVDDMLCLAVAYHKPWTTAYQNPEVVEKIARAMDHLYHQHQNRENKNEVGFRWVGYGPAGAAVHLLAADLQPYLKERATDTRISRRKAWGEVLKASRDFHVERRRVYTNQSMILDMNLYRANSGLRVLFPKLAWPEEKALRLLYESIGLQPWSGSWKAGKPTWTKGRNYMLLTEQALTKELGYVGDYGESPFDLVLHIYDATRPTPHAEGDPLIKDQLVKISKARAVFRYPLPDANGNRSMRLETVIGWRDWKYPGMITYDQRPGRDGGPLDNAAATLDPTLMGYAWQMLEDQHVLPAFQKRAKDGRGKSLFALMISLDAYDTLLQQGPTGKRLPMTPGEPDFVFADPEIGVVALKNGDDILYTSLYWRARYAINNLARVHYFTPQNEFDATVRIKTKFRKSGHVFTMPDLSNEPFNTRHEKFYKGHGMNLAAAGEKQPIAKVPADQTDWKPGKENAFAGKGDFYVMEYGPYLIAMNCTKGTPHKFDVPEAFTGAKDLVSGNPVGEGAKTMTVPGGQTVVLYR